MAVEKDTRTDDDGIELTHESIEEAAAALEEDQKVERFFHVGTHLALGDYVRVTRSFGDPEILGYAIVTGDMNPLHLDDEYASETQFGGRIVHGGLVSGLISAALARLPGTVIYVSQSTSYTAPVLVGERVRATARIEEELDDDRWKVSTRVECVEDGTVCIDGEAVVISKEE